MGHIKFKNKVLFVEFFVRSVAFYGKDKASKIPPKTLHYLGKSLSKKIRYYDIKARSFKDNFEKFFGFKDGKPVVKEGNEHKIEAYDHAKGFCLVAREYYNLEKKEWFRSSDEIVTRCCLPDNFRILSVDNKGNFITDFPRGRTSIPVNKTFVYLCHMTEYSPIPEPKEHRHPNIYLVLYIKNYGFHNKIDVLPKEKFKFIDSSNLCNDKSASIRDYRKSKNKFSF
jgi:hypothetical protein